jgi:hypothetical protein
VPLSRTLLFLLATGCTPGAQRATAPPSSDPLPSWNDGPAKAGIVEFVRRTRTPGDSSFVSEPERIAVFDNDGSLWGEQPLYFQALFMLDRVRALAPAHPEWKQKQPFKAVLEGDLKGLMAMGTTGLGTVALTTHSGLSQEAFDAVVQEWIATARHPVTGARYTDMVYQPQLELLRFLRMSGYKTFIVSGSGAEFMRAWVEPVYGVPPEQVVGSRGKLRYELIDGQPVIMKLPALDLVDDGPGKPVGIAQQIGRRPVIAVGNSDGDYEMLDYTTSGRGPRLGIFIHHDDGAREYAYDRDSHIGRLARGLDSAAAKGWLVTSMKHDWRVIYPPAQ